MIRFSDVRYAVRLWRRHPTMVVVAGLSLAMGVGATTTMYGVVNRVANYDLGFADVDRLTVLWTGNTEKGIRQQPPNSEIVRSLLEHGQSFESFGFFQGGGAPVTLSGTSALNSLFWRLTVADPLVLAATSALMLVVALAAAWVPVHRVTRIDPQHALRQS